jgi:hypothetical protein
MLLTVVMADPQRMAAMRDNLPTPGRVLRYPTSNLASAFESIRANRPGLIVLDSGFLQTESGHGFIDRINLLNIPKVVMQEAVFDRGRWTMKSIGEPGAARPLSASERVVAVKSGLNTRRAPRFQAQDLAKAMADGESINVIDLSVLGAQMISQPMMRPNQKVRVGLLDEAGTIQVTASVAWSIYEKPAQAAQPHFRVGVEFNDAVRETLEEYCRRHCSATPLPVRR